jgi:predicted metal-dependent peptidase
MKMSQTTADQVTDNKVEQMMNVGYPHEITDLSVTRILNKHLVGFLVNSTGFYASVIRNMSKICTRDIPTMGVTFRKDIDQFVLYWNPDFVKRIEAAEDVRARVGTGSSADDTVAMYGDTRIRNILIHEVLHIVLKHVTVRKNEPHFIWNIATDCAINSIICNGDDSQYGVLPPGALVPSKKLLKPDMTSYVRGKDADFSCDLAQAIEELPAGLMSEIYFQSLMDAFRDEIEKAKQQGQGSLGGDGNPGDGGNGVTLDDHDIWSKNSDGSDMSAAEREYVDQRLRELMRSAVMKAEQSDQGWGNIPQHLRALIKSFVVGEIDWRNILRMWANGRIRAETSHSIRRINRRYPYIHPGAKRNHRPLLLIAKDQSGSVSDEAVGLFYAELDSLSRDVDFDQVAFDTECGEVTRWARGSRPEATRERCGGTDFEAPNRLMNDPSNAGRWDGVAILTDGECSKPSPSPVSRIWIVCPGHKLMFQPDDGELVVELSGGRNVSDGGVLG